MRGFAGLLAMTLFSLSAPAAAQVADGLDARLVGVWVNEENMNSEGGGSFAFYSTTMTLQLDADGHVVQATRSVAGGSLSSDTGDVVDFTGDWRADGEVLSVMGMGLTEFVPAARYEFSGDYLVTYNDKGRLVWQRR